MCTAGLGAPGSPHASGSALRPDAHPRRRARRRGLCRIGRALDPSEVIELAAFFMLTMGGNRMAKSWSIEAHGETSSIPASAMSVHG